MVGGVSPSTRSLLSSVCVSVSAPVTSVVELDSSTVQSSRIRVKEVDCERINRDTGRSSRVDSLCHPL